MYQAFYFETPSGRRPVKEFLDDIDEKGLRKFSFELQLLEDHGPQLLEPHAKRLGNGIYELRFSGRESAFRVLYFFDGQRVIFTNAFKKQTQKTPRGEMELALQRRSIYLASKR